MNISYSNPLSFGWDRMKTILFQPFDLAKWFTLGFTAFLAGLLDGPAGSGSTSWNEHNQNLHWDDVADFPATAWAWLTGHIWWLGFILFGITLVIALVILFNWLSSRGKFMFLDNVIHNRAEVSRPWKEYRHEGNALFTWRLVYGIIVFLLFLGIIALAFSMFIGIHAAGFPSSATIGTVVGMALIFLGFIIITGYISLFINDFVVPIMYKNRIGAMQAWGILLKLLGKHFWYFLVYGLFVFVLMIVVVLAVIAFILLTCCIGGILLIIPVVGSVVLLPVSVTFRAFSVAFLEQFGEEFRIFAVEKKA